MITTAQIAFYILAALLVGSALAVVSQRNIVHAALFLVVVFGATAGIFVLLNAEFIAIVQVLIYAGAVTILVLFAIMLTQHPTSPAGNPINRQWWLAGLVSAILAAVVIYAVTATGGTLVNSHSNANIVGAAANGGTVVHIGQLLYSPYTYSYVLPFEIASVVLLVAIIGAIVIGRGEE
jgi:NADH:ubiquinone oxidoreductase subunit 6 (subunit J)